MERKISYSNILKASFSAVVLIVVFFALLLWFFGGKVNMETEIVRLPGLNTVERVDLLETPIKENITKDLSYVIAQRIVQENPQGPQLGQDGLSQIAAINPDDLVEQTIAEGLQNFDAEKLREKVDLARLNITKENTLEAQAEFFSSLNESADRAFSKASLNLENPAQTDFKAISKAYLSFEESIYNHPTPSVLTSFAISMIESLGTQKNIYAALSNYETDPLLAIMALQMEAEITQGIGEIALEMQTYIEDNGIGQYMN